MNVLIKLKMWAAVVKNSQNSMNEKNILSQNVKSFRENKRLPLK